MDGKAATSDYFVRPLTPDDLDPIVAIDRTDSGTGRKRFFAKRLAAMQEHPDDFVHVGVTRQGTLCGFAMAHVLRGEFGRETAVAVLDALAVEPSSRDRGVGRLLIRALDESLRQAGVRSLQSQIDWRRHDLTRFVDAAGFSLAPRIALERSVAAPLCEEVEEI
jgi:predicted N-acetyltransferase YhbS